MVSFFVRQLNLELLSLTCQACDLVVFAIDGVGKDLCALLVNLTVTFEQANRRIGGLQVLLPREFGTGQLFLCAPKQPVCVCQSRAKLRNMPLSHRILGIHVPCIRQEFLDFGF